jgi:hypothetical protein
MVDETVMRLQAPWLENLKAAYTTTLILVSGLLKVARGLEAHDPRSIIYHENDDDEEVAFWPLAANPRKLHRIRPGS